MYKVMAFISRKEGTSKEEFRSYYEGRHAGLILELTPPMSAYRRNYVNISEPFRRDEDAIDFDVVTEMEFESRQLCQEWFDAFRDPEVFARVLEDERHFLDPDRVRVCVVDRMESGPT